MVNGVRGYNPGDPVPASAVHNLGLAAGVDVEPVTAEPTPAPAPPVKAAAAAPVEPPGRGARKQDWVQYATARGMDRQTADDSTIEQLAAADYDLLFGPQ